MSSINSVAKERRMYSKTWKNFGLTLSMVQALRTATESNGVAGFPGFQIRGWRTTISEKIRFRVHILEIVSMVPHLFLKKKVNKHCASGQNFSMKIWTHLCHLLDPETCQSLHSLIAMSLSRLILILPLCALLSNKICIKNNNKWKRDACLYKVKQLHM